MDNKIFQHKMKYIFQFVCSSRNSIEMMNENISIVVVMWLCLCVFLFHISPMENKITWRIHLWMSSTNSLKLPESTWISMRLRIQYLLWQTLCAHWSHSHTNAIYTFKNKNWRFQAEMLNVVLQGDRKSKRSENELKWNDVDMHFE